MLEVSHHWIQGRHSSHNARRLHHDEVIFDLDRDSDYLNIFGERIFLNTMRLTSEKYGASGQDYQVTTEMIAPTSGSF